ncbi:hypothetical protein PROFUN_01091 [Planoprotostelium fungivorum]|uniref:SAM domain-containing protein n=1 Tax=Planoprotostelium fungivorum TaxID=1890364 RepID=A0A2P6NC90_9EUKA|nr:hypothetical protein PROFUN_01091 [Planoprotostelium fungivorum]
MGERFYNAVGNLTGIEFLVPGYRSDQLPEIEWIEDDSTTSIPVKSTEAVLNRKIPSIFYEWRGLQGERAQFTLLYSTGNGDDLYTTKKWMELLRDSLNINILSYEYTGYGINRYGRPSEKQCYEDIRIAFQHLTVTKKIPSERIILFGKSLGTGPTVHLASTLYSSNKETGSRTIGRRNNKKFLRNSEINRTLAGVILQSAMTSVLDIQPDVRNALTTDMFENIKKIRQIRCPIMLVHGTKDQLVSPKHSKKLSKHIYESVANRLIELEGADHENIESDFADDYLDELIEFVRSICPDAVRHIDFDSRAPDEISLSPIKVVTVWLSEIGLEKYNNHFLASGYYDLSSLSRLDDLDLDSLGITDTKERSSIKEHAAKTRAEPNKRHSAPSRAPPLPSDELLKLEMVRHPSAPSMHSSPKGNDLSLSLGDKKGNFITRKLSRRNSGRASARSLQSSMVDYYSSSTPNIYQDLRNSDDKQLRASSSDDKPLRASASDERVVISPTMSSMSSYDPSVPSPLMEERWQNIDSLLGALKTSDIERTSRPLHNTPVALLAGNNQERAVDSPNSFVYKSISNKNLAETKDLARQNKQMQTKIQLLERIVLSQNELISSLNQKVVKLQQAAEEKDERITQLMDNLSLVRLQLTSLSPSLSEEPSPVTPQVKSMLKSGSVGDAKKAQYQAACGERSRSRKMGGLMDNADEFLSEIDKMSEQPETDRTKDNLLGSVDNMEKDQLHHWKADSTHVPFPTWGIHFSFFGGNLSGGLPSMRTNVTPLLSHPMSSNVEHHWNVSDYDTKKAEATIFSLNNNNNEETTAEERKSDTRLRRNIVDHPFFRWQTAKAVKEGFMKTQQQNADDENNNNNNSSNNQSQSLEQSSDKGNDLIGVAVIYDKFLYAVGCDQSGSIFCSDGKAIKIPKSFQEMMSREEVNAMNKAAGGVDDGQSPSMPAPNFTPPPASRSNPSLSYSEQVMQHIRENELHKQNEPSIPPTRLVQFGFTSRESSPRRSAREEQKSPSSSDMMDNHMNVSVLIQSIPVSEGSEKDPEAEPEESSEDYTSDEIEVKSVRLTPRDNFVVLASEDFWNVVSPEEVVDVIYQSRERSAQELSQRLSNIASRRNLHNRVLVLILKLS